MAYVDVHNKDSVVASLIETLEKVVDKEKLEQERKSTGACVCDDYCSYGSTLIPGHAYAMMMQPDGCVNCSELCSIIMSIAINNSTNHQVTVEAVDQRINTELQQAHNGEYIRSIWVDGQGFVRETLDDTVKRIEDFRTKLHNAVVSGRAQQQVDKWYKKYYQLK